MKDQQLTLSRDQYYELIAYLASSAYLMHQGEQYEELYPSIRLMEIATRLTENLIENGGFENEIWPHTFLEEFDESLSLLETNQETFLNFIQHTMLHLVSNMKTTNAQD